ncbi:MMPL family transporter [Paenibacillus algorifonticola]|uniref:MMPL family transporter n=1 Tax=Paenibacillus algorifonticola TaxID=684063 RepID=UPI003D29487A
MKMVIKLRWVLMLVWLLVTVGLMVSAPNMEGLVREKGQVSVPQGYSSTIAEKMIEEIGGKDAGNGSSTVLVFHDPEGLSDADFAAAKQGVEKLKAGKEQYHITSVTTHFDTEELKKQMLSEDGKTLLVLVKVDTSSGDLSGIREGLYSAVSDVPLTHYYTGGWIIGDDVATSAQEGLKKTEFITVGFILIILFLVFRSAVAPIVPLLTVGFTYLLSQSIVAFLVEYFDFPLSNFTQIFLVAVLFGIGTDYCILLISRFKEELAHRGGDIQESILATYKTAGKTVLFSGLAVFVGFASIGFSTFVLYRSAVAVAIGIAILLLALFTIVPFFMSVLGAKLFWPSKGSLEHKESGLWGAVGSFSLRKPLWALVVVMVLTVPFLVAYKGNVSFNSLDEIGDKYDSVKAFNLISESFGPGESLPSTVVVKTAVPMDTTDGLAAIEQITRELSKVEGVALVRSATRPTGEELDDLMVSDQVGTLKDGLDKGEEGLGKISSGLAEASTKLSENEPKLNEAAEGAGKLAAGTKDLKSGIVQLGDGLKRIQQGLNDGSAGAGELAEGLKQAKTSADQLAAASKELLANYEKMEAGVGQLSQAYGGIAAGQQQLAGGLADLHQGITGLGQKYPELTADADYAQVLGAASQMEQSAAMLSEQLTQMNGQLGGITEGLKQANAGLSQAAAGQGELAKGLEKLAQGISQLQQGIAQAAAGQGQIVTKVPDITKGADQLASGQSELQAGFADLNGQLSELTDGLDQSVDGITQVSDGLGSAKNYLSELGSSPNKQMTGWFIPQEAIEKPEFQQALDVYMSEDRMSAKFDVIFSGNPYDMATMAKIEDLNAAVGRALQGTAYAQADYAVGGVTSSNHDLNNISKEDYSRTMMLMLVGITIILIILFRSIVMPLYLMASLLLTFYTSMAITEVIFVRLLGNSGISWAVPFFGFVMLVALGIDYSIFLMDRFREYRDLSPTQAILKAMKSMGGVIMSAAIILGGTFAAMLPSGVMSLLQIATLVLCGLFMYALIMLPLFIPVMVRMFGKANYWPFMNESEHEARYSTTKDISHHS